MWRMAHGGEGPQAGHQAGVYCRPEMVVAVGLRLKRQLPDREEENGPGLVTGWL